MQLFAGKIDFYNFRNYKNFSFTVDKNITILLGENAVGKTNAIEAFELLTSGDSFRHPSVKELINEDAIQSSINLHIYNNKRNINNKLIITESKKQFILNNKPVNSRSIRNILPSILFNPDDLQIIKGSPLLRRKNIDTLGIKLNKNYLTIKNNFEKALIQRNKILKENNIDKNLLDAWTDSFITHATMFYLYRTSLFDRLVPYIKEVYKTLAPHETLEIKYIPSFSERLDIENKTSVNQKLLLTYKQIKDEEYVRKVSLFGPQKDDIVF